MRFYTPAQLAQLTPRSCRFWRDLARAGQLPGALFFAKTPSNSRTQLSGTVRGQWWIPETGLLAWLQSHAAPIQLLIDQVDLEPVFARTPGELKRKVAA